MTKESDGLGQIVGSSILKGLDQIPGIWVSGDRAPDGGEWDLGPGEGSGVWSGVVLHAGSENRSVFSPYPGPGRRRRTSPMRRKSCGTSSPSNAGSATLSLSRVPRSPDSISCMSGR